MLRPLIKVARPADWTGRFAFLATWVGTLALVLPMFLIRLPRAWVIWAGGYPIVVRLVLAVLVLWVMSWVRAWIYAGIPAAPYLVGRTLVFADRGHQRRVKLDQVVDVFVELRPPGLTQVFMVELNDGSSHELCPVDWPGAGRLYVSLAAKLRRQRARRDRRERKLAPRPR